MENQVKGRVRVNEILRMMMSRIKLRNEKISFHLCLRKTSKVKVLHLGINIKSLVVQVSLTLVTC